jgi:hypothetical protein
VESIECTRDFERQQRSPAGGTESVPELFATSFASSQDLHSLLAAKSKQKFHLFVVCYRLFLIIYFFICFICLYFAARSLKSSAGDSFEIRRWRSVP